MGAIDEQDSGAYGTATRGNGDPTDCGGNKESQERSEEREILDIPEGDCGQQPEGGYGRSGKGETFIPTKHHGTEVAALFPAKGA